jgi:dihydroorotate dehydrogenase
LLNDKIFRDLLFKFDPEMAHNIFASIFTTLSYAPQSLNYFIEKNFVIDKQLNQKIFNKDFLNPVGLAAGFDKNATMAKSLCAFGFGFLEFGSVTKIAQNGNAKPRLFRYKKEKSLQNAMGFNNDGAFKIASRLEKIYPFSLPIGINLGKNKWIENNDSIKDYVFLVETFKDIVDYFVINISSPNTKNLRDLQNKDYIKELLSSITQISNKPILIKIAPDMDIKSCVDLCVYAIENNASGIIATNTTNDYSLLENAKDFGGISGAVMKDKSTKVFKAISKELFGKCTLISVGGISNSEDAYERILHGASLVQIYTSIIYEGLSVVKNINQGILDRMKQDGFSHISQAIGAKL